MQAVMTGARGFLGWHSPARKWAPTDHDVRVEDANWDYLTDRVVSADAVIHFGGINRRHEQWSGIRQL
jgi:UDP-2-acetamido-2,6-beta-L-arabino-hexul-4-ose reductase